MIKTACEYLKKKYKSYDFFKMAYKHDAEHDVAKIVTILRDFYVNTECFYKVNYINRVSVCFYIEKYLKRVYVCFSVRN